ncbi:HAD family hydrolase [Enemella evansiae]|uniref:HAD family hydrolase n=1 Tax=Enemella evansiae TaxID=2016499 RepID=UPI000B967756|nr:HAD family hydrolase [Enemella evansiae]OYN94112.1 HAD family hydrolase [Enemella evansiae]
MSNTVGSDAAQQLEVILLDIDGTLLDSTYYHALAWQRAFAGVGIETPLWRVHRAVGMGGDLLVTEVAGEQAEEQHGDELRERWDREYQAVLDEVRPFAGAADFVRAAKAAGYRVALASSGASKFTDKALELLGLSADEVDAITSSDDAEESKPAPDILAVALERAGGGRALAIGDSTWDARAATRFGVPAIGVLTGGISEAELREAGCVEVVDSVAELIERDLGALG